ncbi:biotin--[acetyl-CoA-carboxylase] ligase [Ornithinimicrobium pekingense]|uniref:biotin--[biotin carboxyl-carrier protein] ligase n=1 Tax=Ornithinimicrobium pekingense TaxID=384677 RepID=A0ABQ2F9J9_9MICO|nr:biotin--[acetyl-CoA-carboxylase] ligase [Ornithinimicrobium pekingense]GGK66892.1 biotin--[acetyl-CoA-carboxylase] ligase [Ornithinimicrobium pekingense]
MDILRWAAPEWHATVGSTNTEALTDPRPGRVVVADHQSAGMGRRGRRWSSPPGTGLAVSAVVPPVPQELMGWVPLAAGLALVQALADSRWPLDAALKWPNDVLAPLREGATAQAPVLETVGRRWGKVAGVLAQVAGDGAVVVGTGVNVDHAADQLPVPTATSWRLARGGAPLPAGAREALLTAYLQHLATWHGRLLAQQVRPLRTAYRGVCLTLGRPVVVHRPDGGTTSGTAVDVDDAGALIVGGAEGRTLHHAGDVEHLRPQ